MIESWISRENGLCQGSGVVSRFGDSRGWERVVEGEGGGSMGIVLRCEDWAGVEEGM